MAAQNAALKKALVAASGTAAGGVLKLQNPEGVDLIITRLVVDITTAGPATTTFDAGVDDDGATSDDSLIDGGAASAIATLDNVEDGGTNGKAAVRWESDAYLVITASAALTGLVGNAYIEYIRV